MLFNRKVEQHFFIINIFYTNQIYEINYTG